MPYVVPNSTAQFFIGTNLSPSHENSLYFASVSAKDSYFDGRNKYTATQVTYQRENRGFIRVQLPIASLIHCDYMRFRNTSFENMWFYAFITQVNYINNVTTEVQYLLDPLMTWMGWFSLKRCFIVRQHVVNDAIGANLCDEGLSCGAYVTNRVYQSNDYGANNSVIRIQVANPNSPDANMYGGIFNPTMVSDWTTAETAANYIAELVGQGLQSNIVNVYMIPTAFENLGSINTEFIVHDKPYTSLDGYVPKNNKMFVYPYQYLEVDNTEGATKDYRYEFFWRNTTPSQDTYNFTVEGITAGTVEIGCYPTAYNGVVYEDQTDRITMSHFPQCAWNIDNYQAMLAQHNAYYEQNQYKAAMHGVINTAAKTFLGAVGGTASGDSIDSKGNVTTTASEKGFMGMTQGAISGLTNTAAEMATLAADKMVENTVPVELGNSLRGNPASDLQFNHKKAFIFREKTITSNYARMIDDYFTMYGYKVNQVLVPNMNARPHWTYIQTLGCNAEGQFPAQDARSIEAIFDNGVRLWHNLEEMGNYSLDNSPS